MALADRFKKLVSDRRKEDKKKSMSSGISEEHGEKQQLLDDIIAEIDEKAERERAEK